MPVFEKVNLTQWRDFLSEVDTNSIFQLPEMAAFFDANKKSRSCTVFALKKEKVVGLAIGEISRQYWDIFGLTKKTIFYIEPFFNGDPENLDLLLRGIKEKSEGLFVQIRNSRNISEIEKEIYEKNGFEFQNHLTARILLNDKNEVWNHFEKDKRKGIRKASDKFHLEVKEKSDPEGVELFYSLMKSLYRRKRHPFKPKSYFVNLLRHLGPNMVRIFFAYFDGMPIATQMAFFYKPTVTAVYTATAHEHREKKAGDFLIWHLINVGFNENFQVFDFGGGGSPSRSYGPREYKMRFGCVFENCGRYIYPKKMVYYAIAAIYKMIVKN